MAALERYRTIFQRRRNVVRHWYKPLGLRQNLAGRQGCPGPADAIRSPRHQCGKMVIPVFTGRRTRGAIGLAPGADWKIRQPVANRRGSWVARIPFLLRVGLRRDFFIPPQSARCRDFRGFLTNGRFGFPILPTTPPSGLR